MAPNLTPATAIPKIRFQVDSWSTIRDVFAPVFFDAHVSELGNPHLVAELDHSFYEALESAKRLFVVTAWDSETGEPAGYFVSVLFKHPHYRDSLTSIEDLYMIGPKWRGGFNGVKLFRFVDEELTKLGVERSVIGTKLWLDNGPVLKRCGYKPFETLHSKFLQPKANLKEES